MQVLITQKFEKYGGLAHTKTRQCILTIPASRKDADNPPKKSSARC